jgi:short-subunit dehydrogenase
MLAAITGASSGIGTAFARKLAARGYDLLLIARRTDRLEFIARDLAEQYRIKAEPFTADLADASALEATAARLRSASDLSLLVNNAGFGTQGYFWEAEPGAQQRMHLLHVVATTRLTHAALANLVPRAQTGSGVINVSSVAAFGRVPQSVSYCATKTWMNAFTEGLAIELAGRSSPVKLQALCPGFTLSEFHDVAGVDRSTISPSLWMTSDFVVEESLRAFDRGELIVVPGWRYKLAVGLLRLTPAAAIRRMSAWGVRRYRRA